MTPAEAVDDCVRTRLTAQTNAMHVGDLRRRSISVSFWVLGADVL
jgi:hypothetical protein